MAYFLTKTWGFEEPCGPLQFGDPGLRSKAKRMLSDGDLVIIVGTKGKETASSEQGRLLGIMEPTQHAANSLDYDVRKASNDFDENGEYKWPYALLNARAWIFEDRPLLSEISDRKFEIDSATGIVPLIAEEIQKIETLDRRAVSLLKSVRTEARISGHDEARRYSAPPPTTKRAGIMHMRRAAAYTYCMRLEGANADAFKIGWAFDYRIRAQQFNHAAMPSLGGIRYTIELEHLWSTARQAYSMEQHILEKLRGNCHHDNREIVSGITSTDLKLAWASAIVDTRKT